MDEYIKKEDIEQKIQEGLNNLVLDHDAIEVLGMIYEMPSADVAPVRHGQWERYSDDKFVGYDENGRLKYRKVYKHECSVCLRETAVKSNYCPNCGAKMMEG